MMELNSCWNEGPVVKKMLRCIALNYSVNHMVKCWNRHKVTNFTTFTTKAIHACTACKFSKYREHVPCISAVFVPKDAIVSS